MKKRTKKKIIRVIALLFAILLVLGSVLIAFGTSGSWLSS